MNPSEEKFVRFFNGGYSLAVSMSTVQEIQTKLEELEDTIANAKATAQGVLRRKLEVEAGLSREERAKLITRPDLVVGDAIAGVKRRQDRMSKADKLMELFKEHQAALGVTDAGIKSLMGEIKTDVSKQASHNAGFSFTSKVQEAKETVEAVREETKAAFVDAVSELVSEVKEDKPKTGWGW